MLLFFAKNRVLILIEHTLIDHNACKKQKSLPLKGFLTFSLQSIRHSNTPTDYDCKIPTIILVSHHSKNASAILHWNRVPSIYGFLSERIIWKWSTKKWITRIMIYKSNWFLFSTHFKGRCFQYSVLVTLEAWPIQYLPLLWCS